MVLLKLLMFIVLFNLSKGNDIQGLLDRIDVISSNKSHFYYFNATTVKHNRTLRTIDVKVKLREEMDENAMMHFKLYKMLSNDYKLTAIQGALKFKTVLTYAILGLDKLFHSCSTPEMTWPLQVNLAYHLHDWAPSNLPFVPPGKVKLNMHCIHGKGWSLFNFDVFGDIKHVLKY